MIKIAKSLILTFLLSIQGQACLWVDGTSIHGKHVVHGGYSPARLLKESQAESAEDRLSQLLNLRHSRESDFTQMEINGVEKVAAGEYDQAIAIFQELETDHPGRYSTAVNLGTAYELKGELELALKWIGEGIRRNPESHHGTEWLHLAILKTRIRLKEDPGYLNERHIIDLPDSFSKTSAVNVDGHEYSADQLADALVYQLAERMVFVKPPDPVVADLLFTFGLLEARTEVVEFGIELLEMARDYGYHDSAAIARTIQDYEWLIRFGKFRRVGFWILVIAGVILCLVFACRKRWFFLSQKAYREHWAKTHQDRMANSTIPARCDPPSQ